MNIKEAYSLNPRKVIKKDEGYELHLSKVKLLLNPVNYKEWEILSSAEVINYLIERGFTNIILIRKNREGKPFIKEGNRLYILTDNIDAPKFRIDSREKAVRMAETLGAFHRSAEGFVQPPGIKIKVNWGKRLEKYRTLATKLERYVSYLEGKGEKNSFEEYTARHAGELLKQAKASMKVLKSMSYLKVLEESMKRREICLNTVSSNTARIIDGKLVITKVFDLGYNMAEEDIASLVKKMVGDKKDKSYLDEVIGAYSRMRELNKNSREIIKALVSFPGDSIKVIAKYMERWEDSEELLNKFKYYLEKDLSTEVMGV